MTRRFIHAKITRLTDDQVEQLGDLGLEAKMFWFGCGHVFFVISLERVSESEKTRRGEVGSSSNNLSQWNFFLELSTRLLQLFPRIANSFENLLNFTKSVQT
jgi:hypothetical protein